METQKTLNNLEKIKAVVMGFIGAGIFSQGTLYFSPQRSYNIPRILYPVFEIFGNKGLAVAMIILGLVLLYFGFAKWKKSNGNAITYRIIGIASIAVFFSVLFFSGNKKISTEDVMKTSEETRDKAIASIKEMDKPDFGSREINNHFAIFEINLKHYKDAVAKKDEQAIKTWQTQYIKWSERSAMLMQKLTTNEEKQKMALYVGKSSMKWQEIK